MIFVVFREMSGVGGIIFFLGQSSKMNFFNESQLSSKKSFFVSFRIEFHFFLQNNFLFFSAVQKKNTGGGGNYHFFFEREQKTKCCFAWKQMIPGRRRPEKIWVFEKFRPTKKRSDPNGDVFLDRKTSPSKFIFIPIKNNSSWHKVFCFVGGRGGIIFFCEHKNKIWFCFEQKFTFVF